MTYHMHPSALNDEELMSIVYDEDTLAPEQLAHLEGCSICKQQLAMFTDTTHTLRAKLYRSICPSAVRLSYYCLNRVPEEERIYIASHLLDCPACAAEVAETRKIQSTVELYPSTWSPLTPLRRIFATLITQQAQPALRTASAQSGWPRQYRAETIDLSLHLSRMSNGEMLLLGIITGIEPGRAINTFEGSSVELYNVSAPLSTTDENNESQQPVLSTQVDDVGNILLEEVQAGNYVMIIHLPDQEVVVEGLNITPK